MTKIQVKTSKGRTQVLIGKGLLARAGSLMKAAGITGRVLVVTQKRVEGLHLKPLLKSLRRARYKVTTHLVPDGEQAKSGEELFRLYHGLVDHDFERGDVVLALGGGVVGDVAGFAAATYLRGVSFVNAGTTLLAQVDSSVGGKTGINLGAGKNLVGSFHPAQLVISDVGTLVTLGERELHASLAEVVKYGIIRDAHLFGYLEKFADRILQKDTTCLTQIVARSAAIKADVVSRDEFETKGERMILNYGHTFAHAFEKALGFRKWMHGEAVAAGMACAARLARTLKIFSGEEERRQNDLLERFHLPISLHAMDLETEEVLSAMMRDKKKRSGKLRFVLPRAVGKVVVRDDVPLRLVSKVIKELGGE